MHLSINSVNNKKNGKFRLVFDVIIEVWFIESLQMLLLKYLPHSHFCLGDFFNGWTRWEKSAVSRKWRKNEMVLVHPIELALDELVDGWSSLTL